MFMVDHGQDDTPGNVVSLFEHQHPKRAEQASFLKQAGDDAGELVVTPDDFNYVSKREDNPLPQSAAHPAVEPGYLDTTHKKHYLFKFLEHHKDHCRVDTYHVPGDRLLEFIESIPRRPGRLIEIQQFIPDDVG